MAKVSMAAIDGVAFNMEWVKTKTFAEFCEHEAHHGLSAESMKTVWEYCTGKKVKKEKAAPADEPGEAV